MKLVDLLAKLPRSVITALALLLCVGRWWENEFRVAPCMQQPGHDKSDTLGTAGGGTKIKLCTLRNQRRANKENALIWNWNYSRNLLSL